ncbi:MAG: hypothetical protein AB7S65_01100 [Sulfuricurvum sp.]
MKTFAALYETYASKEIDFETLKQIEASGIVRLENHGFSRSRKNALHCKVYFEPLDKLLAAVVSKRFQSVDALEKILDPSGFAFEKSVDTDHHLIIYTSMSESVEIIADLATDGSICVGHDGIEACNTFNLYVCV